MSISGESLHYFGERHVKTAISDGSTVVPVSVDFLRQRRDGSCTVPGKNGGGGH